MKYAVVTGANKGIGYGIIENLSKSLKPEEDWTIILTARNSQLGEEAAKKLESAPVRVVFEQLDITDGDSIERFAKLVKEIDVLINNAGIACREELGDSTLLPTAELAKIAHTTLQTNYWGTYNVTKALLPNLRPNARIINVSSMLSLTALKNLGDELYEKFTSPMTMSELNQMMTDFESHVSGGDDLALGWPKIMYRFYSVSKLGVTKMTLIMAEELKHDSRNLMINACCPGYVATDLNAHQGHKTIEEGADTPCYLVHVPVGPDAPRGKFFSDRKEVQWKR